MFVSIGAQSDSASDAYDRSPWGNFYFEPIPYRGGLSNLSGDVALQLTAVFACIRVIAEGIASLPFVLYRQAPDGGKTPLRDHWLYKLMKRPNQFQSGFEWREMMSGHCALRGNAFSVIVANSRGEATDLIPKHPDRVGIEMLSDVNWRYWISNPDGTKTPVSRGSMFHLKGLSPNGVIGYNPVALARKALATGLAAQDYGMRFFQNDARPGGWIEHPNYFKDDEQRQLWRAAWQREQTGENRGKVAVLEYGLKFHEVGMNNDDAQFIDTQKMSRSQICALWRVAPHLIGDLDKATFSNIEQQSLDHVIHCLTPWLVRWEEAIEWNFLDPEDETIDCEFPTRSMLRGDAAARMAYYHGGILDGWMTRNEARLLENMNPIDGLDEPLRPMNEVPNDQEPATTPTEGLPPGPKPPGTPAPAKETPINKRKTVPPAPAKQSADARLLALAAASADRIARKEESMLRNRPDEERPALYAKHAQFVANALCVPVARAERYCTAQLEFLALSPHTEDRDFIELARCRLERLAIGLEFQEAA